MGYPVSRGVPFSAGTIPSVYWRHRDRWPTASGPVVRAACLVGRRELTTDRDESNLFFIANWASECRDTLARVRPGGECCGHCRSLAPPVACALVRLLFPPLGSSRGTRPKLPAAFARDVDDRAVRIEK